MSGLINIGNLATIKTFESRISLHKQTNWAQANDLS